MLGEEEGNINIKHIIISLPLAALVGYIFVLNIITVVLADTKYMIYNTHTTPSRLIIHALQVLATYMPQYHKSILLRATIGIFVRTNFASPSEFECDPNVPIFSTIGFELSKLH